MEWLQGMLISGGGATVLVFIMSFMFNKIDVKKWDTWGDGFGKALSKSMESKLLIAPFWRFVEKMYITGILPFLQAFGRGMVSDNAKKLKTETDKKINNKLKSNVSMDDIG